MEQPKVKYDVIDKKWGEQHSVVRSSSLCSPWRRWAARLFDAHVEALLTFVLFVYGFGFLGLIWIFAIPGIVFDSLCFFVGVWVLDSAEYALFGNTLGKFLFGVRIVNANGEKATPSEYMKRNMRVCLEGFALWIPLLSFIAQVVQFVKVVKKRPTSYDKRLGMNVVNEPNHSEVLTCFGVVAFALAIASLWKFWG